MRICKLDSSEIGLSRIGIGTWSLAGRWEMGWGAQGEKQSIETLLAAFEAGINWVDTAPIYGHGKAESIVAKALSEWGKKIYLSTKCGLFKGPRFDLSYESIAKELAGSLKRLKLDYIDLYQIHWPRPDAKLEEAFETLVGLKEQGLIKAIGASNFSIEDLRRVSKIEKPVSLQLPYNLLVANTTEDRLSWCQKNSIASLVYSPLYSGILSEKFSLDWLNGLSKKDWRKRYYKQNKFSFFFT